MRLPLVLLSPMLILGCDSDYPYSIATTADAGTANDAAHDSGTMMIADSALPGDAETDAHIEEICATMAKQDSNNDGTYERITRTTAWVDGSKRIAIRETDSDGDGTFDEREYAVHQDTGNEVGPLLEHSFVDLATGETSEWVTMDYDPQGRPSRQEWYARLSGVRSEVVTWTYHDGSDIAQVVSVWNFDKDGDYKSFSRKFYDEQGRPTRSEWDSSAVDDANGDEVDGWETWEYEGPTTKHSRFDLQGLVHYAETEHDETGHLLRKAVSPNGDTDFDDPDDTVTTHTWKQNTETRHTVEGGQLTHRSRYTYADDDKLVKSELDLDGDGTFESKDMFTYDAYGNLTSIVSCYSGEQVGVSYYKYEYDDNGNFTLSEWDEDGDGMAEVRQTWTYDNEGRLVRSTSESFNDAFDGPSVTDYEYICPSPVQP